MLKNTAHISGPGSLVHPQPLLHVPHAGSAARTVRRVAEGTGLALVLVVALQLVYPANRALPSTNFGGYDLSAATQEDIISSLSSIGEKTFTARTDTHAYAQSLGDIGISLNTQKIADQLADYPLQQRLIPFSFLFYQPKAIDSHLIVRDEAKLAAFADKVAKENNSRPVEGTITNQGGEFTVARSVAGREYRTADIASYFGAFSHQTLAEEAYLPYSSIAPVNSFAHLEGLTEQARQLIEIEYKLTFETATYSLDEYALKAAVRFTAGEDKKLMLDFDTKALLPGLETAADGVFLAPDANVAVGRELNWELTAEAIAKSLKEGQVSAVAVVKPLHATGSKLYPATSKGLQQLIADWKTAHSSVEPAIAFAEIGGYGRRAGIDGDVGYFSASVYKVFPAWYVLDQIDQGKLDPNGTVAAGLNLKDCFYNMIIVSDSKCSEAIIAKYGGWPVIDKFVAGHGIDGITLSSGVTITARGMTQFLHKLDAGELLSDKQTAYLLDHMKRQKYRTGFPAGSAGEVADKVGYQPKTYSWHDTGIVYHPKGKYTLVALTRKGASLPVLAGLARQISDTLNR